MAVSATKAIKPQKATAAGNTALTTAQAVNTVSLRSGSNAVTPASTASMERAIRGKQHGGRESYGERSGYGGYGQGSSQGHHHDPDYQQWRNEQLQNLGDYYNSWRGERYKKFFRRLQLVALQPQPGECRDRSAGELVNYVRPPIRRRHF